MSRRKRDTPGDLIAIGGGEDKRGERVILRAVAEAATHPEGLLLVATPATDEPEAYADTYLPLFRNLGAARVEVLDVRTREDAHNPRRIELVEQADVVFFTGGDQLRIASQVGGTPLLEALHAARRRGATIAGTSAGAAVMPETMLIAGPSDQSVEVDHIDMAPGLGLLPGAIVDTHFAARGRFSRLLSAVARNPRQVGLGLDEDTGVVLRDDCLRVIGSGAVYVVDGASISYSSLAERRSSGIVSVHGFTVHVLAQGQVFSLAQRLPMLP